MRFFYYICLVLLAANSLLAGLPAFAQSPTNDRCSQAQALTPGGFALAITTNAADDLPGLIGCQSGNNPHPDVWFSFQATTSISTIIVTPGPSSTTTPYEILIFEGSCGSGLIGRLDKCVSGGLDSVRVSVTAGAPYYVAIASPSATQTGTFIVQTASRNASVVPAQDCMNANLLATGAPIAQGPFNLGSGRVANEVTTSNSCFGSQTGSNTAERQPKWYKFIAGADGKLLFNIKPTIYTDDYDWAVWDITGDPAGCTTKGNALACNWSPDNGATGLSLCPSREPGYDPGANTFDNKTTNQTGANAPITVRAGHIYALLVDNYSQSSAGFTLTFGGACAPPPGQTATQVGFDAEFDFTQVGCGEFEFRKRNAVAAGAQSSLTYRWTFNNGDAGASTSTEVAPRHTFPISTDTAYSVTLQVEIPALPGLFWQTRRFVTVNPPLPRISRSEPGELCPGDSIILTASGAATYAWQGAGVPANYTATTLTVAPAVTTTYRVVVARNGCTDSTDTEVRVAAPQVSAGVIQAPTGIPPHTTGFQATTPGAVTYQWNFGDGSPLSTEATPTHTYALAGIYPVTLAVTYGPGCVAVAAEIGRVVVELINPGNVITPNNDGKNDYFEVGLSSEAQRLEVFNRWGRKVYERDNYKKEWDGGSLPAGTYYYHLTNAAGKEWKGWVEVIR
ncbi:MAG: gliding motility-associated C-terminal domain-containing protein [Hymenobacteraceae bacterium]|nr:gliding motility-associated C-terminal domain-containing protein [Hymenobacteraceae bacterium]